MATSTYKSSIFIAFVWLLLLFSVDGQELCDFPRGIWKGPCFIHEHCVTQSIEKEGALGGSCPALECWCTYKCADFQYIPSGTWHGPCFSDTICSRQCRVQENHFRGLCRSGQCTWVNFR